MKTTRLFLLSVSILTSAGLHAQEDGACSCKCASATKTATANPETVPQRHPLRGVVVGLSPDQSGFIVKHEEVPGVMKAMTMLFLVDEATFKSPLAKKGTAITGLLVRKNDGWWLEEVKAATAPLTRRCPHPVSSAYYTRPPCLGPCPAVVA